MENLTFFDRLLAEKDELGKRLEKLQAFLGTENFNALSEDHKELLLSQTDWMDAYHKVLCSRIELLTKEGNVPSKPESRVLTYGEKAVGIAFNPGGNPEVEKAKSAYAKIIDQMNELRNSTTSPEVKRLASVAITEAQGAQMWAVKAITWKD